MGGSRRSPALGPLIVGVVLLLVGGAFLLRNLGLVELDWGILWPILVLVIGVVILAAALLGPRGSSGDTHVVVPNDGGGEAGAAASPRCRALPTPGRRQLAGGRHRQRADRRSCRRSIR